MGDSNGVQGGILCPVSVGPCVVWGEVITQVCAGNRKRERMNE